MPRPVVLVVDDDMSVRDAYREVLEQSGFRVVGLSDGRMALDYLRSQPAPEAILLDMVMPSMDGFEFRTTQLRDPQWAAIPTIVVTADRMVPQRWSETNVAAFLTKPVGVPDLLNAVRRAIARHQLSHPNATQLASPARGSSGHESMPR